MIQLKHPKYGICAQEMISPYKTVGRITNQWQMKYGQKFYECELIELMEPVAPQPKPITRPAAIYGNPAHSHSE